MLGGGIYRGSTTLLSGSAGTGKTTLSAQLAATACERGEQTLYVSYEESPDQLMRNMLSVGIDLAAYADKGLLHFYSVRPAAYGLESHLVGLAYLLDQVRPSVTVLDALTSFQHVAEERDVGSMVTRMIDMLKSRGIAALVTTLAHDDGQMSDLAVSSLIDTWLLLRNVESDGERNRLLFVIKSRGTNHSNQVRELVFTDRGLDLVDVYLGRDGMLVGSARVNRQADDREAELERATAAAERRRDLTRQAGDCQIQIDALLATLADTRSEIQRLSDEGDHRDGAERKGREKMRKRRWADAKPSTGSGDHE
jgi:circadian clock protein KaiC